MSKAMESNNDWKSGLRRRLSELTGPTNDEWDSTTTQKGEQDLRSWHVTLAFRMCEVINKGLYFTAEGLPARMYGIPIRLIYFRSTF